MDAVVLAGGYATRLWPITRHRPKMLLPVGETTVIDRILADLADDNRVETVYLSTNEAFADDFRDHIEAEGYEKVTLSVEETSDEDEKFGVVGALAQLVEREEIDDDLFVIGGDNLIGFDTSEFLDYFERKGSTVLAAHDVGSLEKAKSYGLVTLEGEQVVDFQEKPADPQSTLVSIACYGFPAESLRFNEYLLSDNNPDEPGWFIQWLQSKETVNAFVFDDIWFDIGTPGSYMESVEWALDGGSFVHPEATVENCTIGDTVQIMAGAEIRDSELDRTVLFPETTVESCKLDDTILGESVELVDFDARNALITNRRPDSE